MKSNLNKYFDNSATSFPKPMAVADEISRYLNEIGGTYGRSFYTRVINVSRIIEETRNIIAGLIGTRLSSNIVFTHNATHAINIVLKGLPLKGKEIIVSPLEHNSVARPLSHLSKYENVTLKEFPAYEDGTIDITRIHKVITNKTALVVINHQSNINGVIQPVEKVKEIIGDIPILIDAAQSTGHQILKTDENTKPIKYVFLLLLKNL